MADYNWTTGLLGLVGSADQYNRYDNIGEEFAERGTELGNTAVDQTAFTPFTTTSFGGGTTVGPDGASYNLDQNQLDQSNNLSGYADQFFASASGPQDGREQNAYDRIRAMQEPGEARAGASLEGRLAAQGRLGASSSAYGSSPEMFNYNMAINESKNSAAYEAMNQSRMQQAQDAEIGTQFQNNSWFNTASLGNAANLGVQGAQLNQAGDFAGAELGLQANLTGMEGQLNSEQIKAQLMAGLFGSVGGQFKESQEDPLGTVLGKIGEWF